MLLIIEPQKVKIIAKLSFFAQKQAQFTKNQKKSELFRMLYKNLKRIL